MNANELYWSRWKYEESMRIYRNHVRRRQSIKAGQEVSRSQDSVNRERYKRHRKAAESLKRKEEKRRIEKANQLLKEKIQNIQSKPKDSPRVRHPNTVVPQRREDPIKKQQLLVSNIGLLRRIVAAKPFATRDEFAKERKQMERYLKRLRKTRDERKAIMSRRDNIAGENEPSSPTSATSPAPPLLLKDVLPPSLPKKPHHKPSPPQTNKHLNASPRTLRTGKRTSVDILCPSPRIKLLDTYKTQSMERQQQSKSNAFGGQPVSCQVQSELNLLEAEFKKLFHPRQNQPAPATSLPNRSTRGTAPQTSVAINSKHTKPTQSSGTTANKATEAGKSTQSTTLKTLSKTGTETTQKSGQKTPSKKPVQKASSKPSGIDTKGTLDQSTPSSEIQTTQQKTMSENEKPENERTPTEQEHLEKKNDPDERTPTDIARRSTVVVQLTATNLIEEAVGSAMKSFSLK